MAGPHSFKLVVLGRYPAHLKDNQPAVTVNLLSGDAGGHLVHAGTLTMSEPEWEAFAAALRAGLGDRVEIEDHSTG